MSIKNKNGKNITKEKRYYQINFVSLYVLRIIQMRLSFIIYIKHIIKIYIRAGFDCCYIITFFFFAIIIHSTHFFPLILNQLAGKDMGKNSFNDLQVCYAILYFCSILCFSYFTVYQ